MEQRYRIPALPESMRNVDIQEKFDDIVNSRSAMVSIPAYIYPVLNKMGYTEDYLCSIVSRVSVGTRPVIMGMFVKRKSPFRSVFNVK